LLLYLALQVPASRRIEVRTPGKVGIAFVARDGTSAAVASFPDDILAKGQRPSDALLRPRRRRWWLERYGTAAPAPELDRLLEQWNDFPRAPTPEFQIVARHGRTEGNARLQFRWASAT
jgi:hypothetical protein